MSLPDNPYGCSECEGEGEVECDCCGSEVTCEACKGSGLDPDLIDIKAWEAAANALTRKHGCSWAWVDRDTGVYLGREGTDGDRIAYADFLVGRAESTAQDTEDHAS